MMRRLTEVPLLLVTTLRPSPQAAEHGQLVDDALQSGAKLIRLAALSDVDVMTLVQASWAFHPDRCSPRRCGAPAATRCGWWSSCGRSPKRRCST